jgi:superfamily II DNA or RNA helicase
MTKADEHLWKPQLTIKPKAEKDSVRAYDHQLAAWDRTTKHFVSDKKQAGLIVVPTGGGKTVIAAHWLLKNHIQNGGRVLWLAHRRSLLRQAMNTFEKLGNLAYPKSALELIAISSDHARWPMVSDAHDVVFSSMQTAVLENNQGFVEEFVESSTKGLFVVVDEAHHAPAPGYKRLLSDLKKRKAKLLGLTATPVRMVDEDQDRLWHLFDDSIVYQISRRELIDRRILSSPSFTTVKTNVNVERDFTDEDLKWISRYGEIGPSVLHRLAKHAGRNRTIVEQYVQNRETYGSTLVFAADTLHAQTLAEEFKKASIDADYVDYSRKDAQRIIERYRSQKKPDVLVNVEMLTEGFDAPHTRTVFIARPTMSESLVAQMVGRALRGKQAGGNDASHLVTFLDTWEQFDVIDTEYVEGRAPLAGARARASPSPSSSSTTPTSCCTAM